MIARIARSTPSTACGEGSGRVGGSGRGLSQRRGQDAVERVVGVARPLRRAARGEVGPALLLQHAVGVVLLGHPDQAAVEALGVAADLAVEHVEIDDAERPVLGDAVGGVGCRLDEIDGSGHAVRGAAIVAAAEQVSPLGLGAVRAHFLRLAAVDVIAPGGDEAVGAGMAGRLAEPGIVDPALALAERVGIRGGELAEAVVGGGAGAGGDVDPADRHRGLVAEGVVDVIGLEPQRRGAGLDHLLGQKPRRRVIGKRRRPRQARRRPAWPTLTI
jgi:hypothetical protein